MIDHFVHGDGQRGVQPLNDHTEGITDQNDIDSGGIGDTAEWEVIGGQRHDGVATTLMFQNVRYGDLAVHNKPSWDRRWRACAGGLYRSWMRDSMKHRVGVESSLGNIASTNRKPLAQGALRLGPIFP